MTDVMAGAQENHRVSYIDPAFKDMIKNAKKKSKENTASSSSRSSDAIASEGESETL
jgi:hypothetical protein